MSRRHRILSDLLDAWSALHNGGDVPRRSDFDPRVMGPVLDYMFVLERISPGVARFRVAGGHLSQLMRMEVRGMPITALAQPAFRQLLGEQVDRVFDLPATLELGLGRSDLRADLMALPVAQEDGTITHAVGALVARAVPQGAMALSRFAVTSQRLTPVMPVPRSGLAEQASPFAPAPRGPGRPPLRLVKG